MTQATARNWKILCLAAFMAAGAALWFLGDRFYQAVFQTYACRGIACIEARGQRQADGKAFAFYDACAFLESPTGIGILNGVPFDRETGEPFPGAKDCIRKGLTKAFGIALKPNGLGMTGQNEHCPHCFELDRKMAAILAHNNRSGRSPISVGQMVRALAGRECERA